MARILIVDDDEVSLEFAGHALKVADHVVTLTTSPRVAITLAATSPFDLVVSDINMPGMTGFAMAAILNADSAHRWIPLIFTSSRDDGKSFQQAFGVGAVDYLVKPFSRDNLAATVQRKLFETEQRRLAAAQPGSALRA